VIHFKRFIKLGLSVLGKFFWVSLVPHGIRVKH